MNPKKSRDLCPEIAKEMDLPLELVEDLHDFYWLDIHRKLSSFDHSHILVPHLFTFHIRSTDVLEKTINKYNKSNERYRNNTPKSMKTYARFMETETDIEKLNKLLANKKAERVERDRIREIRKDVRKAKEDLGQ